MLTITKEKFELYLNNTLPINSYRLKNHLYNSNLKDRKCESCGITEWIGKPAPLELHHIDGNNKNNNLSNLNILCCNCHGMTTNFRAGNTKKANKNGHISEDKYKEAIENSPNARQSCIALGIAAYGGNYERIHRIQKKFNLIFRERTIIEKEEILNIKREKMGIKRRNKYNNKDEAILAICKVKNRPSREELLKMIWDNSTTYIGRQYGVTDNAIRKWAFNYKIPVPPVGYWRKFAVGRMDECGKIKSELFAKFDIT